MIVEPFKQSHVQDAADLALGTYRAECLDVGILPMHDEYRNLFAESLAGLAGGASGLPGFAATEGGRLLGYIAGYPVERFFSTHRGAYVPPTGHCAAGNDRRLIYQKLYEAASAAWVAEGRLTHCISMWAHDAVALDAWYWLGFGLRCVDAVRLLTDVIGAAALPNLQVRKIGPEHAETLYPLHSEHCRYYPQAPLFMPRVEMEDGPQEFREWLEGESHHLWAAFDGSDPVSYMRIRHGGETFVSDDPAMVNVCAAYTTPSARGAGAGAALLQAIVEWARSQGCERLGVDYESFNIYGSRFWMKHFTPFMYSAVRVIDDRIL